MFRKVIDIRKVVSGPESSDLADSLDGLAIALEHQGHFSEAKECFENALTIDDKELGKDNPRTIVIRQHYERLQRH